MPIYRISTGNLTGTVETPHEADARTLATHFLALNIGRGPLGLLTEVSGGQYVGDNETYFLTTALCKSLGRLHPDLG